MLSKRQRQRSKDKEYYTPVACLLIICLKKIKYFANCCVNVLNLLNIRNRWTKLYRVEYWAWNIFRCNNCKKDCNSK